VILAGDVGGTKCNLALFDGRPGAFVRAHYRRFASHDYPNFEQIVREFVVDSRSDFSGKVAAACFGVAGPVIQQRVRATNLPWIVDAASLSQQLGVARIVLLNDLEATAHSLHWLRPAEYCSLNEGESNPQANRALIAAGTGLGEAILVWDGRRHVISATEGGHAGLNPYNERGLELFRVLRQRLGFVDCEAVLSGRGFRVIHEFLDASIRHPSFDAPDADPAAEITHLALTQACPVCVKSLDLWVELYAAEAGNLAMRTLARGGLYVAGGIAVKILPKLKDGAFFRVFCDKGAFGPLLSKIPLRVVLNEDAPLLGAAACAAGAFD
jgi:glucokinase